MPILFVSLGLGGLGLSYASVLAPYQNIFQFFAVGMIIWAHYRMDHHSLKKSTQIFIWGATIIIISVTLLPFALRLFLI
ncbi:MAG: hypothetical protein D5S00_05780 [Tindallia sp. MSAO_Bac2]|nr:MAG: hypothetical protein D5S00_05780 [Tindallia sp. MSAO_Bac2]